MAARSRVVPRKQQSIPRLELCAALSGSQLSKLLVTELTIPIHSVTHWSDSTTVLTWLKSSSCRYKVFVGTRVAEIQEPTSSASWCYVKSGDNLADDITRGKFLRDLQWGAGGVRVHHSSSYHQIVGLDNLPYLLKSKAVSWDGLHSVGQWLLPHPCQSQSNTTP